MTIERRLLWADEYPEYAVIVQRARSFPKFSQKTRVDCALFYLYRGRLDVPRFCADLGVSKAAFYRAYHPPHLAHKAHGYWMFVNNQEAAFGGRAT